MAIRVGGKMRNLNVQIGDMSCNAAMSMPHLQANAASAKSRNGNDISVGDFPIRRLRDFALAANGGKAGCNRSI